MASDGSLDEAARLAALEAYDILDTPAEAQFDRLTRIAAQTAGTPIALMSLIDRDRQWFKSKVGLGASETPREQAFCAHAIQGDEVMVVEDARADPRFADNPLVTGEPKIRFYAGAPLVTPDGHSIGTLCTIDNASRQLSADQIQALEDLAAVAVDALELRRSVRELDAARKETAVARRILDEALQALDEGIAIYDGDDRLLFCNPQYREVRGYLGDIEDPVGWRFADLSARGVAHGSQPDDAGCVDMDARLTQKLEIHDQPNGEPRLARTEDGRHYRIAEYPTRSGGLVRIHTDVTEIEESKQRAQAANRSKSDFLAMMSHEIRTPLNAVLGMLTLLQRSALNTEQLELTRTARSAGETLLALINDILDFSKLEADRVELEEIEFTAADVVDDVIDILSPNLSGKTVALTAYAAPEAELRVLGDASRTRQVLLNLVGNAVKFTSEGSVSVSATLEPDGMFHFAVRDTGIGIAPDKMAGLFQAFVQGDGSVNRKFGGSGLGLAISRRLARLMGGDITVASTQGTGSCFVLTLPLRRAVPGEVPKAPRRFEGKRVLLIGDNRPLRDSLHRQFETWGAAVFALDSRYATETRISGALSGKERPHLLMIDASTPALDNDGVRSLLSDRSAGQPPILWVGPVSTELADSAIRRDDPIINTPIRARQLRSHLERALHSAVQGGVAPSNADVRGDLGASVGLQILVAEDNSANQLLMRRALRGFGHYVDIAANGIEAVELCSQKEYDVILMDIQMPEMDGIEAVGALRTRHGDGLPPVFALTAEALSGDRERFLSLGFDDHFAKPVDLDALELRLRELAGTRDAPAASKALGAMADDSDPILDEAILDQLRRYLRPSDLWPLVGQFLGDARGRTEKIGEAVEALDLETARRDAHSLVGICGNYGARRISRLAREIEAACVENNAVQVRKLTEKLDIELGVSAEAHFRWLSELKDGARGAATT